MLELQAKNIPLTNDSPKYRYADDGKFGLEAQYNFEKCSGQILAIRKDGQFVDTLSTGEQGVLILDQTCFYAEQGGQIYDTGVFSKIDDESTEFTVKNTQVRGGYIAFVGSAEGSFKVGDKVNQIFDEPRRWLIMKNHTGTHLLNHCLQQVLNNVDQKGSLVAPDRMRFDFTAKQAMTPEQLKEVEKKAERVIETKCNVFSKECNLAQAREINGLRAVFDETYPDPVRVVSIGVEVDKLLKDPSSDLGTINSVEFCGGTHLRNVSHIGHLVITSEEAIAKGIRRIVAVTGPEAERAIHRAERMEERLKSLQKTVESNKNLATDQENFKRVGKEIIEFIEELNPQQMPYWRKDAIREQAKNLQRLLDSYDRQAKAAVADKIVEEAKALNSKLTPDSKTVVHMFSGGGNGKALNLAIREMNKAEAIMAFSVCEDIGKVVAVTKVNKNLTEKNGLKASEWINKVCEIIGGRGGGNDQQAQATGDALEKVNEAIQAAKEFAQLKLG